MTTLALLALLVVATLAYAAGASRPDEAVPVAQSATEILAALDEFEAFHALPATPEPVQCARAVYVAEQLTGQPHPIHTKERAA